MSSCVLIAEESRRAHLIPLTLADSVRGAEETRQEALMLVW